MLPLPVGGPTDIVARITADELGTVLGKTIVVDNRPGAGGLIGTEMAAHAAPDGYNLLFGASSYNAVFASLYRKLPYDPLRDFAPIALVAKVPNVLVVNPATKIDTVKDFVAAAKAAPGKMSYASSGNGSSLHLAMELLKRQTGIDVVHVPYKGGSPAATLDLIGKRIDVMFDNLPGQLGHIKAGRTRPLAVTSAERNAQLPHVPTMIEAGVAGFEVTVWYGLFAPAGVPKPIVAKLSDAAMTALNAPRTKERLADQGAIPAPMRPAQFAEFQKAEIERWGKVVKDAGVPLL